MITPRLSRRHALLAVSAVGALAACGGGDDGSASEGSSGSPSAGPTPRTVSHPLGETEVPDPAQRIAVVDRRGTVCHLVSLGLLPVAALTHEAIIGQALPQVLEGQVDGVEVLPTADSLDEPNLEVLAAARPDLILGWSDGMETIYDKLSGIAPTVAIGVDFADAAVTLRNVAEAVGEPERGEEVVAAFDQRLTEAAEVVADPGTVTVLLGVGDGTFRVYEPGSVAICGWLEQFGAELGPTAEELGASPTEWGFVEISEENLPDLTSETIVLLYNTGSEGDAAVAEIEESPLWAGLPAVEAGRVIRLNSQEAVAQFGFPGYESALDDLLEQWQEL